MSTHLRIHGDKMWSLATRARPGFRPRTYWNTREVYGGRGSRYGRRKMTRVAIAACDYLLARFDETVRLSQDAVPTCPVCAVIRDRLLELNFSKPLTVRRLRAVLGVSP